MNLNVKIISLLFALSECGLKAISGLQLYEKNNTDSYLSSLQIIRKYGYPAESHLTTTEDDYILELHRIPHGKNPDLKNRGIPIFMQHGLLGSSADFLLIGPNQALPFLLSDRGYDVWLGNIRGNTYSRAHKTLTPEDRKFWNFSWHEPGLYDVTASIDYICNYTRQNDLIYVGFSMGTTMFFVMASSRPEYQNKIRGAILMAAVTYLKNARTPLRVLAPLANDLQVLSDLFTDGELIQQSTAYRYLVRYACTLNNLERDICRNIIFLITGCDPLQFNEDLLPSILNHIPAGASTKCITHYAQLIQSGEFQQFDYGLKENLIKYHSSVPPGYNLEVVSTPLYIFEGRNDFLSTLGDVNRLVKRLPNVRSVDVVDYDHFNHYDFILGNNVKTLLYDRILARLETFLDEGEEPKQVDVYEDLNDKELTDF